MKNSPIWHPFTQMKNTLSPLKVVKGEGPYLITDEGQKIFDCISSWWVNIHGHAHPRIAEAIYAQALQLEHVIFAGFTHEPAEQVAEMVLDVLPNHFSKVFFSDNGSTAVEVALKLAYQYWRNQGENDRRLFLCFEGSYHGDTLGAMSVGERSLFTSPFQDLLFKVHFVPYPTTHIDDEDIEDKEAKALKAVEDCFLLNPGQYAAVIIEPLVQGAGGMRMCRPQFLEKLQKLVKDYQTLLIYDEVMTGFGRTGEWFACQKAKTSPDLICLAKGLTGGFLPLSLTVCTEEIFAGFLSDDRMKTFFHGHSYTANPLGCAAACASLKLLHESTAIFQQMESHHRGHLKQLQKQHATVKNIRTCGTIAAFDVVTKQADGYLNDIGLKLRESFLREGLLIRPLGNTVYLMPPYCTTHIHLNQIYQTISEELKKIR
ncbi:MULTISPECIES: adenosylmethionine--8-amino-7-oxononanoate transaminase [Parachlamydia]|jgi:adenosylmethionine-8-amino-7-oxononanoate aminotransferase|uniref:Adenosylmethionine-8-amino-7-oxononanoate aminotransferase n=2 Tax=Parachlamydia acanthamoebae TaxID=83552 RepID=F8KZG6_PARAV|nr:adenosylmethionine--8-amino-7-oxononanoate transaminase [Parachlamydia acanthamoebae]EFB41808.1 hypothetical protein pah_c022o096 [Parachlamydia acanthamoebae str. Hall's coccus]KIA77962.1 Adenosylmethionine-8-amino-7-oxononanoate aminotransferase [Parachlamydia acanthamoebae]CCB86306.1 adenosylmethionine-8-amino-7-oxononanoate aminotransferase [Parachlamydia acanthamoebae UV-7]